MSIVDSAKWSAAPVALPDVDVDRELLWELPARAGSLAPGRPYGWLAGVIRELRRHLVGECGSTGTGWRSWVTGASAGARRHEPGARV